MLEKSGNRIELIDALRGGAALCVTWFHIFTFTNCEAEIFYSGYLGLGVEVFFALSGFVIPFSMWRLDYYLKKDFLRFLIKRMVRLDIPFYGSILVMYLFANIYMKGGEIGGSMVPIDSFLHLFYHLTYLCGVMDFSWVNNVYWTLAIELQFNLLLSLLVGLLVSNNRNYGIFTLLLMSLMWLLPFSSPDILTFWINAFIPGILAFLYKIDKLENSHYILLFILNLVSSYYNIGLEPALVASLTGLALLMPNIKVLSVFKFFGKISYSLYLVHSPVCMFALYFLYGFSGNETTSLANAFVILVLCIIFSIQFHYVFEVPALKIASNLRIGRK